MSHIFAVLRRRRAAVLFAIDGALWAAAFVTFGFARYVLEGSSLSAAASATPWEMLVFFAFVASCGHWALGSVFKLQQGRYLIGALEELRKIDVLEPQPRRQRGTMLNIVGETFHPKSPRKVQHPQADSSRANYPDRLTPEPSSPECLVGESRVVVRFNCLPQPSRERKDQCKGVFRDSVVPVVGHMRNQHSGTSAGLTRSSVELKPIQGRQKRAVGVETARGARWRGREGSAAAAPVAVSF